MICILVDRLSNLHTLIKEHVDKEFKIGFVTNENDIQMISEKHDVEVNIEDLKGRSFAEIENIV